MASRGEPSRRGGVGRRRRLYALRCRANPDGAVCNEDEHPPRLPRELLFDQMRSVVLSDDRTGGGELILKAELLRFAAHWGFMPRSCRP